MYRGNRILIVLLMKRMATQYYILVALIVFSGCTQTKRSEPLAAQQSLAAPYHVRVVGCWFLESDGAGHSGYQAADTANGSATPQTASLYKSIGELRAALLKEHATNIVSAQGYTNGGWKIRGLTADEFAALR
jgi:hypothetical protein